ncbi:MAG: PP2C family protein-serine/threonine phosphatase, partial [Candidatus Eremiobacterota bacterium]
STFSRWRNGEATLGELDRARSRFGASVTGLRRQADDELARRLAAVQSTQRTWFLALVLLLVVEGAYFFRPLFRHVLRKVEALGTMHHGLEAASRVQRAMLPSQPPRIPGLDLSWEFRPCDSVAGDMFGVQHLDDTHLGIHILDVSGHGIPAALLSVSLGRMLSAQPGADGLVRRALPTRPYYEIARPSQVVRELNRRFPVMDETNQFVSLVYGILDLESRCFTFVRAGHPGPVIASSSELCPVSGDPGPPVGILDDLEYEEESIFLREGDHIFLYTDAATETRNEKGELFGADRLLQVLRENRRHGVSACLRSVRERLEDFSGRDRLVDDLTLLGFGLTPTVDGDALARLLGSGWNARMLR